MDVTLSKIKRLPRREIYTLTASDAAFPIPLWAQGGKGIVYVTGCAGGASGGLFGGTGTTIAAGGAAGAEAARLPIPISAGVSTVQVVIGAGGAPITSATNSTNNAGGNTTLTVGTAYLLLQGGRANSQIQYPTVANSAKAVRKNTTSNSGNGAAPFGNNSTTLVNGSVASPFLLWGAVGESGASDDKGAGAHSNHGGGGAGNPSAVYADGDSATGYGAGGAGAYSDQVTARSSGAGAPGLLILEFVEGF